MGKKNIVINGKPYQNVSNIKVRDVNGQDMHDFRNTDDATIESKDIPIGKVGYGKDGKVIGTAIQTSGDGEINFYDQYGAWLTSYRLEDLPLSALPEIPALEGAGADQYEFAWTMTLEEVNALTEEANIGVDVTAKEGAKTYLIPNEFGFSGDTGSTYFYGGGEASTILIDWGDGTNTTANIPANNSTYVVHTFGIKSHNPITIEKVSGGNFYLGGSSKFIVNTQAKEIRVGYDVKGISCEFLTENFFVENVILHNTMELIGIGNSNIFDGCHKLKSLNIPKSFKNLDTSTSSAVVHTCHQIETIFIHEGVEGVNIIAHSCSSLKNIIFPKSIKEINIPLSSYGYLVYGAYSLRKLKLPKSVDFADIGGSFIDNCFAIKEINVPEGVTTIGPNFARKCYSLDSITFPSTLLSINSSGIFSTVYAVQQIIMKSAEPPTLSNAFSTSFIKGRVKLYVPKGSLEAYTTATNWSALAETTVEY